MIARTSRETTWEERAWLRKKYGEMKACVVQARKMVDLFRVTGVAHPQQLHIFDSYAELVDRRWQEALPPNRSGAVWVIHFFNRTRAHGQIYDFFRQALDLYIVGNFQSWDEYLKKIRGIQFDPTVNPYAAHLPPWLRAECIEGKLSKRGKKWLLETAIRIQVLQAQQRASKADNERKP